MRKAEITVRIRRFKEIAEKTDDTNIYNTCMNRLSVLEIMLERYEASQFMLTGEWYDEETEFRSTYENTVEEMIEQRPKQNTGDMENKVKDLMTRIVIYKNYLEMAKRLVGHDQSRINSAEALMILDQTELRKEVMVNPPNEVVLDVNLPESVDTPRKLRNYFLKHFGIDIGIEEENEDSYEKLFYNSDLRSYMGDVWDLWGIPPVRIRFLTQYFIDRQFLDETKIDLSGSYSKTWRQIVRQSDICDSVSEKIVVESIGKPIRK
jgi:hypothetical protein